MISLHTNVAIRLLLDSSSSNTAVTGMLLERLTITGAGRPFVQGH